MSVSPSVAREVEGDGLVLSLAGDWTVANSAALEATADSLSEPAHERGGAILDLSRVDRMDTAGAWAIDRARAELAGAGVHASYRGARPEYCGSPEGGGLPAGRTAEADPPADRDFAPERGGRVGLHRGPRSRRRRELFRRDRRDDHSPAALSASLAMDGDDLPARELLAAERADHHADQFPGRRHRDAAGHLPARPVRRVDLRRQSGRRARHARARAC